MKKYTLILIGLILFQSQFIAAQSKLPQIPPSDLETRREAVALKAQKLENTWFQDYPIRNIGPTVMGGRVVDIAVNPKDHKEFYVAYASGGLFKTKNKGLSFEAIFDNQARLNIGDIAISPANEKVLWVGTGENNSSRSSYAGYGVYKSSDAGKTWQLMGLEATQHIGRIICHPQNENIAWVASLGALYSSNQDRGVYMTNDGGKTWDKTLFINEDTGVIDLMINPKNPLQLWAAAWERDRKAWDFKENGSGSGVYFSEDGGKTWKKQSQGLPESKFMGRMGLDICAEQPNILYMVLDNQEEVKKEKEVEKDAPKFKYEDFKNMSVEAFLQLNTADLDTFLLKKNFPAKYNGQKVKADIQAGKYLPKALAEYYKDANDALFNTQVKGAELYRSDDYGKNWKKVNSYDLEGVVFSYGYYFGQVRVAPDKPERVYILGVPIIRSEDGGKSFELIAQNERVHADHHALWINPDDSQHILLGNDGGLYSSYDAGDHFLHHNNVAVGQFYTVEVDMEKPYNVYGGLQDNGVFKGSSQFRPNRGSFWERLFGGDGMFVQVNPKNSNLLYTGYQFGNYVRIESGKRPQRITPRHDIGEDPLRFNWRTPVIMSQYNPDILYFCAQKVYRSVNRGEQWQSISPDLSHNLPNGNVPFSTITTLSESPHSMEVLCAGTDDGRVQITKNGGSTWEDISPETLKGRWVSSVFISPHEEGTIFVSANAYRFDELKALAFVSRDFGKTWTEISRNLPNEALNVIIQDPEVADLLYVGSDEGAYLSVNFGQDWQLISGDYPNVATYDLIVHPRDHELVLASHGRSIYIMDVKPLQKIARDKVAKPLYAFAPASIRHSESWGEKRYPYRPAFEPEREVLYFVTKADSKVNIRIQNESKNSIFKTEGMNKAGFHRFTWDLKDAQGNYVPPGKYSIEISQGSAKVNTQLEVRKSR